jgi:hypothetical protein
MKPNFDRTVQTVMIGTLTVLNLCTTCWGGPPGPPNIPSTPVGNAEMSAVTVLAVAAYGYWKNRK